MLKRKSARTNPCGTPFLRSGNLLRLPLAVARVKLRLPTSSMTKRTMSLSGSNRSNLQVKAALTAVTDVIKEFVWFIIVHCLFTVGSGKFLHLSFAIFVGEDLTVIGFVWEECEKTLRTTDLLLSCTLHSALKWPGGLQGHRKIGKLGWTSHSPVTNLRISQVDHGLEPRTFGSPRNSFL